MIIYDLTNVNMLNKTQKQNKRKAQIKTLIVRKFDFLFRNRLARNLYIININLTLIVNLLLVFLLHNTNKMLVFKDFSNILWDLIRLTLNTY